MRKAKLYALTLAAIMAVGSAPVYTYASPAQTEVNVETEDPAEETETAQTEEETNSTVEENTGEEETPEEETKNTNENTQPSPEAQTETPAQEEQPTGTPSGETETDTKTIQLNKNNLTTVLNELKTAKEKNLILEVTDEVSVSASCEIKPAEGKTLTVKRSAAYTGNMFKVASGATLTVSNVKLDGSTAASTEKGGAVIYSEGTVVLRGCTITGNASDSGAVYLSGTGNILSGALTITGNKTADKKTERNLYLAGGASFNVDSAWDKASKVGVTSAKTDAGTAVYKVAESYPITSEELTALGSSIVCENAGLTIAYDEASRTGSLAAAATPTPTPPAKDTYDATQHKDQNTISGLKESYEEAERMVFTVTGAGLSDNPDPKPGDTAYVPQPKDEEGNVRGAILTNNDTGTRYTIANFGLKEDNTYGGSATLKVPAGTYTLTITYDLKEWAEGTKSWEEAQTVAGQTATVSQTIQVTAAPTTTPAAGYDATEHQGDNKILGVNSSYRQNSRLSFTVQGAGLERENPKAGDTAYVPYSVILSCSDGKNYSIAISDDDHDGQYTGSATLSKSKVPTGNTTLTVYYRLHQWTDGIDSWASAPEVEIAEEGEGEVTASTSFRVTAASTTGTSTKKTTTTAKKKSSSSGSSSKAKSSSSSSSKAKNADTADETPILPLAGLCAASVLAGGLVITRKRKLDQ